MGDFFVTLIAVMAALYFGILAGKLLTEVDIQKKLSHDCQVQYYMPSPEAGDE